MYEKFRDIFLDSGFFVINMYPFLFLYNTIICVVHMYDYLFWKRSPSDIDNIIKYFK